MRGIELIQRLLKYILLSDITIIDQKIVDRSGKMYYAGTSRLARKIWYRESPAL